MKKKYAFLAAILSGVLLLIILLPAAAAEDLSVGRYLIDIPADKKLTVRAAPSSSSETIDYLLANETVEIVQTVNGWAMARQNGKFGWFDARYAQLQQAYDCAVLLADISSANATSVNFSQLKAAGVGGVILRLGVSINGGQVIAADSNFASYYEKAREADLYVGVYFASSAVTADAIEKEANWVREQLGTQVFNLSLPVFYRPTTAEQKALSSAQNTLLVSAFCRDIESAGFTAGIYLPADWTSKNMDFSALSSYVRWIADTGDYCNFTHSFDIWQYTSSDSMDGVSGSVGLSYLFTDIVKEPSEPISTEPSSSTEVPSETDPVPEESTTELLPDLPSHRQGDFVTVREPGCSTWGEERAYCLDCGALLHIRLLPPVGHKDSRWEVLREASTEEGGILVRHCDVCGEICKAQRTQPLGSTHTHVLTDWSYIDAVKESLLRPLSREEGMTGDGGSQEQIFACTVDREKVMTCADCGEIVAVYADTPAAHVPEDQPVIIDADCETDGHSRLFCQDCGAVIEDIITPAYGHYVGEWEIIREATLEAAGERQGVCLRCGKTVTEEIPKLEGVRGDVNGDGKVTSADARLILRFSVQLDKPASDAVRLLADVDENGSVNTADARKALRIAVGLDAE